MPSRGCLRARWFSLAAGTALLLIGAERSAAQQLPTPAWGLQPTVATVRVPAGSTGAATTLPDTADPRRACPGCPVRRVPWAVVEALLTNVITNRFDYYLHPNPDERGEGGTFDVSPETWADNLANGWTWDDNSFMTNQFGHPYQGSMYFNSGRSNGLSFWESAPLAVMGSFTWEYFGETAQPSMNDFIATSIGGVAMGESFYRVATLVRDNTRHGWSRTWRELVALPLDPIGGINRLLFGEFGRTMPNPDYRMPAVVHGAVEVGAVSTSDTTTGSGALTQVQPFVRLDLLYGDDFATPFRNPFDVFRFTVQVGGGNDSLGSLATLHVLGRLWGFTLNERDTWRFSLDQDFQYQQNPAYEVGGQSVLGRFVHRRDLGGGWTLDAVAGGAAILLGAIKAESVQVGEREYDFGPGLGFVAGAGLRRGGHPIGRLSYTNYFIGTLSGSNGRHLVQDVAVHGQLPVWRGLGVGAAAHLFLRNSFYPDYDDTRQDALQVRAFGTYFF